MSGSWDCTARVWDLQDGSCIRVLRGHRAFVTSCDAICFRGAQKDHENECNAQLSPCALLALSGGNDGVLKVWDLMSTASGRDGCIVSTKHGGGSAGEGAAAVRLCSFRPQGATILSGSAGGPTSSSVRRWELELQGLG